MASSRTGHRSRSPSGVGTERSQRKRKKRARAQGSDLEGGPTKEHERAVVRHVRRTKTKKVSQRRDPLGRFLAAYVPHRDFLGRFAFKKLKERPPRKPPRFT